VDIKKASAPLVYMCHMKKILYVPPLGEGRGKNGERRFGIEST